jgi:multidrug efflux system membrane fusion protein
LVRDTAQGVWVTGLSEQADVIVLGQEYVTNGVPVAPKFAEVSQ